MKDKSFVLDNNIWYSYFYNGNYNIIFELVDIFGIVFYRSVHSTEELQRILSRKKFTKQSILPTEFYMDFLL